MKDQIEDFLVPQTKLSSQTDTSAALRSIKLHSTSATTQSELNFPSQDFSAHQPSTPNSGQLTINCPQPSYSAQLEDYASSTRNLIDENITSPSLKLRVRKIELEKIQISSIHQKHTDSDPPITDNYPKIPSNPINYKKGYIINLEGNLEHNHPGPNQLYTYSNNHVNNCHPETTPSVGQCLPDNQKEHLESSPTTMNHEVKINSNENLAVQPPASIPENTAEASIRPSFVAILPTTIFTSFRVRIMTTLKSFLSSLHKMQKIEPKLVIIRTLTICTMMLILSIIGCSATRGQVPYSALTTAIYCYLVFFILENIVRIQFHQRPAWSIREDKINIADAVSGLILLLCMRNVSIATLAVATGSCGVTVIIYYFSTKTSSMMMFFGVMSRIFYTLLVLMIMLELTGLIHYAWGLVLTPFWFYFSLTITRMIYLSLSLIYNNLVFIITDTAHQGLYHAKCRKRLYIGSWLLGYHVLDLVVVMYIASVTFILQQEDDHHLLRNASIAGVVLSSTLLITAKLMLNTFYQHYRLLTLLHTFEEDINADDDDDDEEAQIQEQAANASKTKIVFSTIKQAKYFFRSSDCYFVTPSADILHDHTFIMKNKQHAHKQSQDQTKFLYAYDTRVRQRSATFLHSIQPKQESKDNTVSTEKLADSLTITQRRSCAFPLHSPTITPAQKKNLAKEGSLCYVCCVRPHNTVMTKCGHGGVCYGCVELHVREKQECMECRTLVESIACGVEETGLENVYRSSELVEVIRSVETAAVTPIEVMLSMVE